MKRKSINAVLNPLQLENFCTLFGLRPSDIDTNFDGWHKHVLMTKDVVFLFPRSPQYANEVTQELSLYDEFTRLDSIVFPKLIKRVKDKEISYYEFGAVTRLPGEPFSRFQESISSEQTQNFLTDLSKIIGKWHNIPLSELPKILHRSQIVKAKKVTQKNWHKKTLEIEHTKAAVDFIYAFIKKHTPSGLFDANLGDEKVTKQMWTEVLQEIAKLEHVLVHSDVHEDQILVDPKRLKITAVLDWETARIDNPVWDFNFGEWGLEIWNCLNNFSTFRREMWKTYLGIRGIELSTYNGLHLFYTLFEFIKLVEQKDKQSIPITKANFHRSVEIYIDKLVKIGS